VSEFRLHRLAVFALIISPLFLLCAIIGGCASLSMTSMTKQEPVPNQYTEQLDQLVIHSNFPISKQHRLLQELQSLRSEIGATLMVPVSSEAVHVYLFEDAERFGDFVRRKYPTFPARRAFFIESDTQLAVYAHWGDRIAEDLRHEVSHGYMHSMVHELPLWLDEGLAEYFEVAQGQHGINRPHVEDLRHAMLNGRWKPDLAKLEQLTDATEMSQRHYAESWLWVHWMLQSEQPAGTNPTQPPQFGGTSQLENAPRFSRRAEVLHSYIRDMTNHQEKLKPISQRITELRLNHNEELIKYLQTLPTEQ
jgi:hypothetical protein